MTMLFVDSFDAKDGVTKWPTFGGTTSSTTRFSFGSSMLCADDTVPARQTFPAASQLFIGFAHRNDSNSGSNTAAFLLLYGDSSTTLHLNLRLSGTQLQLFRGATQIAAVSSVILPATWNYIEMSGTVDSTTGSAVVKINGTAVISFTGNTKAGGTNNTIDGIALNGQHGGGNTYFDDLYICNSSGSTNNTFLGDCRAELLLPSGAGTSTQFTPTGSSNNWQNVNDVPDSTSTYNSDATAGHRDTYAMGDLIAGTGTIFAVQQVMAAFKTGAGTASLKAAQLSGATVSYGATRSLGTSPAVYADMFETNPATSVAWTASDVNNIESGAEVV